MTAITKWDGAPIWSPEVPVYASAFAAALDGTAKYARDASRRAGEAVLYLRHVPYLSGFDVPPAAALEAAIAALDCAKTDLEAALSSINATKIAAE